MGNKVAVLSEAVSFMIRPGLPQPDGSAECAKADVAEDQIIAHVGALLVVADVFKQQVVQ